MIYTCLHCKKECVWGHSKSNKYCSNACQKLYESKLKIDAWLTGNNRPPRGSVKRYLHQKQNSCCAICGNTDTWEGTKLVLILDHVDGNSENNQPSNLRLVCPNCDSQLPTFKNRNRGNGRYLRRKRFQEGKSF